jgi:flagellar biosynthesis protein FliR
MIGKIKKFAFGHIFSLASNRMLNFSSLTIPWFWRSLVPMCIRTFFGFMCSPFFRMKFQQVLAPPRMNRLTVFPFGENFLGMILLRIESLSIR